MRERPQSIKGAEASRRQIQEAALNGADRVTTLESSEEERAIKRQLALKLHLGDTVHLLNAMSSGRPQILAC